ncbi:MAG: hypothetical protein K2O65_10880, partial [Lachnospiraceae bacterium]|nr:hypothetical protein [Lachnospiraceae bacterium]
MSEMERSGIERAARSKTSQKSCIKQKRERAQQDRAAARSKTKQNLVSSKSESERSKIEPAKSSKESKQLRRNQNEKNWYVDQRWRLSGIKCG